MNTLLEEYIRTAIRSLRYDFNAFQINHFLRHFKAVRNRPLVIKRHDFDPDLFGLCYANARHDYIFVNSTLHRAHQLHTVLHEVAHLYLKHTGNNLCRVLGPAWCAKLGVAGEVGHVRGTHYESHFDPDQEHESELFVRFLRHEIAAARRFYELQTPTSVPEMEPYMRGLDLTL